MSLKFLPTEDQSHISKTLLSAVVNNDKNTVIAVKAPAGTGKTALTTHFMEELQEKDNTKRIGYFVFNSFMKKEIDTRTFVKEIYNAQCFTYHSFLLKHALENEKIKEHFLDKEGNTKIDFTKHNYKKSEISTSSQKVLKADNFFLTELLESTLTSWLNSSEKLIKFCNNISKSIYDLDIIENREENEAKSHKSARENINTVTQGLMMASERILSRQKNSFSGEIPPHTILALFLSQSINHIMKTNPLSHSGYYKEVYEIAMKNKIDLFEEFDTIIIDEAQDMDKIFKQLMNLSDSPLMVIGDTSQSIYGWRGAMDMMEEIEQRKNTLSMSLDYSFRYKNDIAQFSNLLLCEKEKPPKVFVTGGYTSSTNNIRKELATANDFANSVSDMVQKRLYLYERFEGIIFQDAPKKDLAKFLAKEKTAFISRNNKALIKTIFEVLPIIRKMELDNYISISLTDTVSSDFTKIKEGDFGYRANKKIEERLGQSYTAYRKDKSLNQLLEDYTVREVLFDDNKLDFLLDTTKLENFNYLLENLSSRKQDTISKNDKNANLVFTTVHGSKGKEYERVFLSDDIFSPDKKGLISEEEINIAYVAVTRAKQELCFYSNGDSPYPAHPLFNLFKEKENAIEEILSESYTYTFPHGVDLKIEKMGSLYIHSFSNRDKSINELFMLDFPIKTGMIGYLADECQEYIKYYDKAEKGYVAIDFKGDEHILNKKDNITNFHYGTGKTQDDSILAHIEVKEKITNTKDVLIGNSQFLQMDVGM